MKIIRYFLREEDDATGEHGFLPLWVPKSAGFNASDARSMLHDALEHRLCDSGKAHEEVMAFGRVIALRYIPGVLHTMRHSGSELGGLITGASDFQYDWDRAIPDPGPVMLPEGSDEIHSVIRQMVKDMARSARSEEEDMEIPSHVCTRVARLLGLGFLDAMRRYGGYSGCNSLGWATHSWAERSAKTIEALARNSNDGDVLRLVIDTDSGEVRHTLIEDGRRHGWLRQRIVRWYRA